MSLQSQKPLLQISLFLKENKNIKQIKVLMVNSGNANAYTGKQGYSNLKIISLLATKYNCKKEQVIVSSTGVIGEQLPMDKIYKTLIKLKNISSKNSSEDWKKFTYSIMTTDTFPKAIIRKTKVDKKTINLIGIARGSGMIAPNMATMLGYIFTDIDLPSNILKRLLIEVNEKSFNSITVDSDTSTNDMVCFFLLRYKMQS